MIFPNRYIVRHERNAAGEPVTEVFDRRRRTASRFRGLMLTDTAIIFLERQRAECAKKRMRA